MKLLLASTAVVMLWSWTLPALRADKLQDIACIEEIEIPRYSAVARLAIKTGTVRAQVSIGRDGRVSDVTLAAPDPRLADEVRGCLKETGRFLPSCAGRQITLKFTFRLEGEATHYPFAIVRFRSPNHFIIISQPRLPHIYYRPIEAPKEQNNSHSP